MNKKCPICHHFIVEPNRGSQASAGEDENGQPLPFWTDDPLLTSKGLGATEWESTPKGLIPKNWIGIDRVKVSTHIKELQDYYKEQEEKLLLESNRTEWIKIEKDKPIRHAHIKQLRESVEKLLPKIGLTLADYFKFNYLGTKIELPYIKYGEEINTHQTNWTDPELDSKTRIKAIHIEELRRGLMIFWRETWDSARIEGNSVLSDSLFRTHVDFFGPPYNVGCKSYTAPVKTLIADNRWSVSHEVGLCSFYNFRYVVGNWNSEWSIEDEDDKFLEYKGGITNFKSTIPDSGNAYDTISFGTNFETDNYFKCNKNTKFKIFDCNLFMQNTYNIVIKKSSYWDPWRLIWHNTSNVINYTIAHRPVFEGIIKINVYFEKSYYWWSWYWGLRWLHGSVRGGSPDAYITYYAKFGSQKAPGADNDVPSCGIEIESGDINRNLFEDVKLIFNNNAKFAKNGLGHPFDINEENFDWEVKRISIYIYGKIYIFSVGWLDVDWLGRTWGRSGWIENSKLDTDFSINKIQLINKSEDNL